MKFISIINKIYIPVFLIVLAIVVVSYYKIIKSNNNLMKEIELSVNDSSKEPRIEKDDSVFIDKSYNGRIVESNELKEVEKQAEDFNIPSDLKDEIIDLVKTGKPLEEDKELNQTELKEAVLMEESVADIESDSKLKNLGSGFDVAEEDYVAMINSCLPKTNDDQEAKEFKSGALADIGYSALERCNYVIAEEAFNMIIIYYKDSRTAPIVTFELAKLMIDQNRFEESESLLNSAKQLYGQDDSYNEMISELQGIINRKQ